MILAHPRARPGRLVRAALSAAVLAIATVLAPGSAEAAPPAHAAGKAGAETAAHKAESGARVEVDHRHYRKGGKHRSWKKRHWKRDRHYYGKRHGFHGKRHGHHWKKRWHYGKRYHGPRRHGGYAYRFGGPGSFGFYYVPKREHSWRRHH